MDGAQSTLSTSHVSVSHSIPAFASLYNTFLVGELVPFRREIEGDPWQPCFDRRFVPLFTSVLFVPWILLMSLMKTMTYAKRQRVGEFSFFHGGQLFMSLYDNPSHHQGVSDSVPGVHMTTQKF